MYQLIREKSEIYKKLSNFVHEKRSPFLGLKTQKMLFYLTAVPFFTKKTNMLWKEFYRAQNI